MSLHFLNVCCLQALGAVGNIECYRLAFGKRLEAAALDRGVVNEDVRAVFLGDETVTLGIVKPLDSSLCHAEAPPFFKIKDCGTVLSRHHNKDRKPTAVITDTSETLKIVFHREFEKSRVFCRAMPKNQAIEERKSVIPLILRGVVVSFRMIPSHAFEVRRLFLSPRPMRTR